MRREELGSDGHVKSVAITDPTSGTSLVFEPAANLAHRAEVATLISQTGTAEDAATERRVTVFYSPEAKPHTQIKAAQEAELKAKQHAEQTDATHAAAKTHVTEHVTVSPAGAMTWVAAGRSGTSSPATKEELGQQVIEGVTAKGTRTTTVIPAGAIGNELPISVTSEEWFSPDLKVLVTTKHADPRSGETTYRLTGITCGEPDPSLFELPAGVTIR